MIETRRAQRRFGDGPIAAEVANLHEVWMRQADRALDVRRSWRRPIKPSPSGIRKSAVVAG